jgi:hypothetical protein
MEASFSSSSLVLAAAMLAVILFADKVESTER